MFLKLLEESFLFFLFEIAEFMKVFSNKLELRKKVSHKFVILKLVAFPAFPTEMTLKTYLKSVFIELQVIFVSNVKCFHQGYLDMKKELNIVRFIK